MLVRIHVRLNIEPALQHPTMLCHMIAVCSASMTSTSTILLTLFIQILPISERLKKSKFFLILCHKFINTLKSLLFICILQPYILLALPLSPWQSHQCIACCGRRGMKYGHTPGLESYTLGQVNYLNHICSSEDNIDTYHAEML